MTIESDSERRDLEHGRGLLNLRDAQLPAKTPRDRAGHLTVF
jgi:hypothetical protein